MRRTGRKMTGERWLTVISARTVAESMSPKTESETVTSILERVECSFRDKCHINTQLCIKKRHCDNLNFFFFLIN